MSFIGLIIALLWPHPKDIAQVPFEMPIAVLPACQFEQGWAYLDDYALSFATQDGMVSLTSNTARPLRHADDLNNPLVFSQLIGRRIRLCTEHYSEPIVVLGGLPPRDFAMTLAAANWAGESPMAPAAKDAALVRHGLGASRMATREAAHRLLKARGSAAVPALLWGLRYQDAEVRYRSALLLETLRIGDW